MLPVKSYKVLGSHMPKKWVFKRRLNCPRESHCHSSAGKEVHTWGPAAAKHCADIFNGTAQFPTRRNNNIGSRNSHFSFCYGGNSKSRTYVALKVSTSTPVEKAPVGHAAAVAARRAAVVSARRHQFANCHRAHRAAPALHG